MNRITALLLAMAALLVHVLVVHRDLPGAFAPPFDSAHVAYHLGRNLVHEGALAWNIDPATGATEGGLWSYPSPLLVALSTVFERVYLKVTWTSQIVGILCVLLTVYLSTRFDRDRIAGVVPALLLVTCGAMAASGASGTEWPIAAFLLATAFVALEHGRPRFAALSLALLVVTRPEGIIIAVALAIQTTLRRRTARVASHVPPLIVFLPAVLMLAVAHVMGASLMSDVARILRPDMATVTQGLLQLRDFVVATISPLLLVFPLVALVLGELSGVGRRALALTLVWCASSVAAGGGPAVFDIAFTPALPIVFVAIQQGIARGLDTYRASMERLAWVAIALAIAGSLLAGRFQSDLNRFDLQERVWTAAAATPTGRSPLLGRAALHSEIQLTVRLRQVGTFLRERLPQGASVLSPWPGAIGYLSHHPVIDVFGRTTVHPGTDRVSWSPDPPRAHILAALATEPDYILPSLRGEESLEKGEFASVFVERLLGFDADDGEALRADVAAILARYDLVVTTGIALDTRLLILLRKRGLGVPPTPHLESVVGGVIAFRVGFGTTDGDPDDAELPQVFDAIVTAVYADGSRVILDPAGRPRAAQALRTIVGAVIDPKWQAEVTLARIPVSVFAADPPVVRLEARLLHHRLNSDHPLADAAPQLVYLPH